MQGYSKKKCMRERERQANTVGKALLRFENTLLLLEKRDPESVSREAFLMVLIGVGNGTGVFRCLFGAGAKKAFRLSYSQDMDAECGASIFGYVELALLAGRMRVSIVNMTRSSAALVNPGALEDKLVEVPDGVW